jgi:rubrerythrin
MRFTAWQAQKRSDDEREAAATVGISRAGLLARTLLGLGSLSAGGAVALAAGSATRALGPRDRAVLEFALTLERLQVAFYSEASGSSAITGEAHQFAQVVAAEERLHLAYLEKALGVTTGVAPRFRFGDALSSPGKFILAAVAIEETGVAAYNGQATNLSRRVLARVDRVISVEARHAAWARALAGLQPAPVAIDVPISATQAQAALRRYIA